MSEIALTTSSRWKELSTENHLVKNSFQKFHGQRFFFAIVQGTRRRNDRIESNENETSNLRGRLTKTEQECNE